MAILEQLKPVELAQRIVKRDQPQQQVVSPRAELARLHDPRDRRFHVKNKCPRTATHIRDDRRDCVLRRAEIVETRSRVAVVTIGQDHLVQLYVIDYWHLSAPFVTRETQWSWKAASRGSSSRS